MSAADPRTWHIRNSGIGWLVFVVIASAPSLGRGEDDKSGVRPNAISLPDGPGSVGGLGAAFEPDLTSGSSTYRVDIKLPRGTAGVQPTLNLSYNSGYGNGPVGMGWKLSGAGEVSRDTSRGVPRYDAGDVFAHNGARLVEVEVDTYRPEIEGAFVRIERQSDGSFALRRQDGTIERYGKSAAARTTGPHGDFAWKLEEVMDPSGNRIEFSYTRDGGQLYLSEIEYNLRDGASEHVVTLEYESRGDVRTEYRAGFAIETAWRLCGLRVTANGAHGWSYALSYEDDAPLSRLQSVEFVGRDEESRLPPLSFGYSSIDLAQTAVRSMGHPAGANLNNGNMQLSDVDGDALPDILDGTAASYRWWKNLGDRFSDWRSFSFSPSVSLGDTHSTLADVNGDGVADVLTRVTETFRYNANDRGSWLSGVELAGSPSLSVGDGNVRVYDYDGDGILRLAPGGLGHVVLVPKHGRGLRGGRFASRTGSWCLSGRPRCPPGGLQRRWADRLRHGAFGIGTVLAVQGLGSVRRGGLTLAGPCDTGRLAAQPAGA